MTPAASAGAPAPTAVSDPGPSPPPADGSGVVRVSPMRRRDLRSVLRIDAQQPHQGWSLGLYLAELRRSRPLPAGTGSAGSDARENPAAASVAGPRYDRRYLVARVDGRVAGFAGVLLQPPDAHITTIAVDDAVRGRKIGTRLMIVVARLAAAAGADSLTLEVRAGNAAALALYRRFGLAPVGVRKGYYADIGEDALVMWAHDLASGDYAARLAAIEADLGTPTVVEGLDR